MEGCGESGTGSIGGYQNLYYMNIILGKGLLIMTEVESIKTPYFLVDEKLLRKNLQILERVQRESGCKILLAQKAFSMFACYPLISKFLTGTTASGLYEARLGKEEFKGETHIFSPAFREDEFDEILQYVDDIVFNSPDELLTFGPRAKVSGKSIGLRLNPECSTQEGHAIYDPCAPFSRLGTTLANFEKALKNNKEIIELIDGFHFHTLCEQDFEALDITLKAVIEKFGKYFGNIKWLNLGGGHHITREDYNVDGLIKLLKETGAKYGIDIYLEPGEAVVLNSGFLISSVLTTINNGMDIAILDTSAACHMPDVLEMPYRPPVLDSGKTNEKAYTYRLGGPSCLAGDIIGDYSFDSPLKKGDKVVFGDMALYTMVKTNTFNGMPLPAIAYRDSEGKLFLVREFSYNDFKTRLS